MYLKYNHEGHEGHEDNAMRLCEEPVPRNQCVARGGPGKS